MKDNKSYYYLKLKDSFFDSEEIKILEGMENGYKYSNILLKMYLKSIKRDGLLIVNERIPYDAKMIATVTGHNINDIKQALVLFQELGLIEILSNGAIYILDIQNFIGQSTTEADRIRLYRKSIEENKTNLLGSEKPVISTFNTNTVQMPYKCTTEIKIEKDIELEKDLEKELEKDLEIELDTEKNIQSGKPEYKSIIDYLNEKAGTSYKASSAKTKTLIDARLKEGFTENDFYTAIDKKCVDWIGGDMEKFLRPETLFSNKFEGYLNQKVTRQKTALEMLDELYE